MNWQIFSKKQQRSSYDRHYVPLLTRLHLDWWLSFGIIILLIIGSVTLISASSQSSDLLERQGLRIALSWGMLVVLAQIPPRYLKMAAPWLYAVGTILMMVVLVLGEIGKGAQRWLDFGIVRFQPSEMMKIAVPLMLAWFLSEKRLPPTVMNTAVAGVLLIVPTVLIAKQPDLGTALLVGSSGCFVLFLAGMSWKLITAFGMLGAAGLPALWYTMHDYQKQRVYTLFNPESDPLGTGYHIIQSKIAIGSGGVFGKGWLNGTQSNLQFLPERHTDSIFSVFGEEFGLFGACILLSFYFFIIARGMMIAMQAQDTFTRLLAGSITMTFFVYVFVNIGMVTGLLPVVGVPLPLVSYGGTSMVTLMAGFGILMSIHTHRKLLTT
jgi:rod shape determining protein RodA